jgi:hypothetical protein
VRGVRSVPLAVAIGVTIDGAAGAGRKASHGYSLAGPRRAPREDDAQAVRQPHRRLAHRRRQRGAALQRPGRLDAHAVGRAGIWPPTSRRSPARPRQWRRLAKVPSTRMSAPSPLPTT